MGAGTWGCAAGVLTAIQRPCLGGTFSRGTRIRWYAWRDRAASCLAAMQRHYILAAFLVEERASGGVRAITALRVSLTSLTGMKSWKLISGGAGEVVTLMDTKPSLVILQY